MTNKEEPKSQRSPFLKYAGLASQMGGTIYLGNLLGEWLDKNHPYEGVSYHKVVTLVAVFLSMYQVIRQVTRESK